MRMTWGKAVVGWLPPRSAFSLLMHLNNKYALDGTDPNSFTGVMWCFGKKARPTSKHARILDRYMAIVDAAEYPPAL